MITLYHLHNPELYPSHSIHAAIHYPTSSPSSYILVITQHKEWRFIPRTVKKTSNLGRVWSKDKKYFRDSISRAGDSHLHLHLQMIKFENSIMNKFIYLVVIFECSLFHVYLWNLVSMCEHSFINQACAMM